MPASGGPMSTHGVDATPALTGRALNLARSSGPRTLQRPNGLRPHCPTPGLALVHGAGARRASGAFLVCGVPAVRGTPPGPYGPGSLFGVVPSRLSGQVLRTTGVPMTLRPRGPSHVRNRSFFGLRDVRGPEDRANCVARPVRAGLRRVYMSHVCPPEGAGIIGNRGAP
jgi:hypothetical protein